MFERVVVINIFIAGITVILISPALAMTPEEISTIIDKVFSGLIGLLTACGVIFNIYQTNKLKTKVSETTQIAHDLKVTVDGRLTQLLEQTAKASRSEGNVEGRMELHAENIAGVGASTKRP